MSLDAGPETLASIFDSVEVVVDDEPVTVPGDLMEQCHDAAFDVAEFRSTSDAVAYNAIYNSELQRRFDVMVRVCAGGEFVIRHML